MNARIITRTIAACFLTCLAATAADDPSGRAIPLGSLDLTAVRTGWGEARANQSVGGNVLSIGGRKFATGIGMHAEGGMHLALDGQAAAFEKFPKPGRIRYDGHCFQIEGKDTFIYCATFHYFRTPQELWRDRFQKLKEAGFNTVETYTPWNWHERQMPAGLDDFSKLDLSELEAWLKMAQDEFGFYTIVRPGPFICAEWAGGGYPRWLAKFGPGRKNILTLGLRQTIHGAIVRAAEIAPYPDAAEIRN